MCGHLIIAVLPVEEGEFLLLLLLFLALLVFNVLVIMRIVKSICTC